MEIETNEVVKCPLCLEPFHEPKVLACFHSFCKTCLERQMEGRSMDKIVCPQCNVETQLTGQLGLNSLLNDFGLENMLKRQMSVERKSFVLGSPSSTSSCPLLADSPAYDQNSNTTSPCTSCKNGERASAFCQDCADFLCAACTNAHQSMHCFESHHVEQLTQGCALPEKFTTCKCLQHRSQPLRYFCLTCNLAICRECTQLEHASPAHQFELIADVADDQMSIMEALVQGARAKQCKLLEMFKAVDAAQNSLNISAARARTALEDVAQALTAMVEDCHKKAVKELEVAFGSKQLQLTYIDKKVQQMTEKLSQTIEFTQRLIKYSTPTEVMLFKQLLQARFQLFHSFNPDANNILETSCEIEPIVPNMDSARQQIGAIMGLTDGQSEASTKKVSSTVSGMPPTPIGHPPSRQMITYPNTAVLTKSVNYSDSNLLRLKQEVDYSGQNLGILPKIVAVDGVNGKHYEKWSSGMDPALSLQIVDSSAINSTTTKTSVTNSQNSTRTQIKRHKMIYHCKFGEFGVMEGQFTEPSGVAVTVQNDIVVADTNNHRIQVFDKEGRFKFQFGECGKRDGQLLYPNRVAVNRANGDFIVTERSPTHQIQIYNQYGQFLRKFGANILQHPRGVCVDNKGRIIVIECKVMRVIMFDAFGNVVQKFNCSRYLEFPNGVCTNNRQEILISDNRAHCIKVFNYDGAFIRQIGGEGITNYPIGVGINSQGEVVVADNHNNFNLTVFSQDGALVSALESKVKHAQCFDMALVEDGSVVLASKDYRLYLYRYRAGTP